MKSTKSEKLEDDKTALKMGWRKSIKVIFVLLGLKRETNNKLDEKI
mgnify:CR=1 FL=1